jgi:hypothetical protein
LDSGWQRQAPACRWFCECDGPSASSEEGSGPHRLCFAGGSPSQSRCIAIGGPDSACRCHPDRSRRNPPPYAGHTRSRIRLCICLGAALQ